MPPTNAYTASTEAGAVRRSPQSRTPPRQCPQPPSAAAGRCWLQGEPHMLRPMPSPFMPSPFMSCPMPSPSMSNFHTCHICRLQTSRERSWQHRAAETHGADGAGMRHRGFECASCASGRAALSGGARGPRAAPPTFEVAGAVAEEGVRPPHVRHPHQRLRPQVGGQEQAPLCRRKSEVRKSTRHSTCSRHQCCQHVVMIVSSLRLSDGLQWNGGGGVVGGMGAEWVRKLM